MSTMLIWKCDDCKALMLGARRSYAAHCAYAMGALPFLPPESGGPFDGPKDQLALLRYTESLDLITSEFLPVDEAAWPEAWRGGFKLRSGGKEDVLPTGKRAGATPKYVLECVANDYVLTKARIHADRIVEASAAEGSELGRPGAG